MLSLHKLLFELCTDIFHGHIHHIGLFGYNSFLVGLAIATFYSPEVHSGYYWPVMIGVIVFAYFSR